MKKVKLSLLIFTLITLCIVAGLFAGCADKKEYFTVSYKSQDGGFVVGNPVQTVESGSDCLEVTAIAQEGYTFIGWDDGVTTAKRTDKKISENKEYTAKFSQIILTVTYEEAEGGTISGENVQAVVYGGEATTVKAIPDEDHIFIGWSDGVPTAERTDKNLIFNLIVNPVFWPKEWQATYTSNIHSACNFETEIRTVGIFEASEITVKPNLGYKFVSWSDGVTDPTRTDYYNGSNLLVEAILEIDALELPVMVINTENLQEITSKEIYLNCSVSVFNADEEYCFEGNTARIRGRGNTSWTMPKKPYKLKFDSKINLFGNGKAKTWTLIANYYDPSLIRNYLAYNIANELLDNLAYTTTTKLIDLYVNGEYLGVYLICEQNEVGSTRVDIDEDIQDKNGNIKVDTGYFLESDFYIASDGIEGQDYFVVNGQPYAIKSPDTEEEYYIEHKGEFVGFIQNIIQNAIDLINSEDTSENYSKICQYVDVNSFLDGYIIDDLFNLGDLEWTSFYLYYDSTDKKVHRGTIWDYDAGAGNCQYHAPKATSPYELWAIRISWYKGLLNHSEFKMALEERLDQLKDNFNTCLNLQIESIFKLNLSFERNFKKWDILGKDAGLGNWNTPEITKIDTWEGQVLYVKDWLEKSFNYLLTVYCNNADNN